MKCRWHTQKCRPWKANYKSADILVFDLDYCWEYSIATKDMKEHEKCFGIDCELAKEKKKKRKTNESLCMARPNTIESTMNNVHTWMMYYAFISKHWKQSFFFTVCRRLQTRNGFSNCFHFRITFFFLFVRTACSITTNITHNNKNKNQNKWNDTQHKLDIFSTQEIKQTIM